MPSAMWAAVIDAPRWLPLSSQSEIHKCDSGGQESQLAHS